MAFPMPDLKGLAQRARNAFRAEMPGTDAWVWPNNVYVSAKVFGGIVYEIFLRLKWIDKQRFAATATLEGLVKIGNEYALPMTGASAAQGSVNVPATYPFDVPVGTVFTNTSTGLTYISTQDVGAVSYDTSGVVSVPVVCQSTGAAGNMLAGASLATTLTGLTGGVSTVLVGSSGIGSGADVEQTEAYRTRILARKRQPPMGGSPPDYVAWAKQVPGVTRVFSVKNAFGLGTVGVWFMMDVTYPFGIPQPADVANVQSHLNSVAPTAATVIALAPVPSSTGIVVNGIHPDTPTTRQAVAAEMLALFQNMTQPGLPGSTFTLRHSWLEQAVSNVTGEQYNEGVSSPSADTVFSAGVVPVLASVTFAP